MHSVFYFPSLPSHLPLEGALGNIPRLWALIPYSWAPYSLILSLLLLLLYLTPLLLSYPSWPFHTQCIFHKQLTSDTCKTDCLGPRTSAHPAEATHTHGHKYTCKAYTLQNLSHKA